MKRTIPAVIVVIMLALITASLIGCVRLTTDSTKVILHFHYGENDIHEELTENEAEEIRKMISGKFYTLELGTPSCGFTKDVSIEIGGKYYCPACDNCTTIYDPNVDRYFEITEEQRSILEDIFSAHGGVFPCV